MIDNFITRRIKASVVFRLVSVVYFQIFNNMKIGILFIFFFSTSSGQIANDDSSDTFDWSIFSKEFDDDFDENFESNEEWSAEESSMIDDRSVGDYELREAHPYSKVCEIDVKPSNIVFQLNPDYDYSPIPKDNVTCKHSIVNDPKSYSRHQSPKSFCIIKHQRRNHDHNLCETIYLDVPIFRRKKGHGEMQNWMKWKNVQFGKGCRCYYGVKTIDPAKFIHEKKFVDL